MEQITGTGMRAAMATKRGVREYNMDAAAVFESASGLVAAAVVDGIGNDADGAATMRLVAETAVRIGVSRGVLAGVLAAAALVEDPGVGDVAPDGVLVLALAEPGGSTLLGWVGDSHAYGWDGTTLRRRTDPHTMGAFLSQNGDLDLAPRHDNWVRISLASASATTVAMSRIPAGELVLLVSDGLDDVPLARLQDLLVEHQHNSQALVDVIVATATEDGQGYRDDATAVVLCPTWENNGGNPDDAGAPHPN